MSGLHRSPKRVAPANARGLSSSLVEADLRGEREGFSLSDIVSNPGLLKLELMVQGVQLDPELYVRARGEEAFRNYFANTRDIELWLPEGMHVTAPVGRSPYILIERGGEFVLQVDPDRLPEERRGERARQVEHFRAQFLHLFLIVHKFCQKVRLAKTVEIFPIVDGKHFRGRLDVGPGLQVLQSWGGKEEGVGAALIEHTCALAFNALLALWGRVSASPGVHARCTGWNV